MLRKHAVLANAGFRSATMVVGIALKAAGDLASERAAYCGFAANLFGRTAVPEDVVI